MTSLVEVIGAGRATNSATYRQQVVLQPPQHPPPSTLLPALASKGTWSRLEPDLKDPQQNCQSVLFFREKGTTLVEL